MRPWAPACAGATEEAAGTICLVRTTSVAGLVCGGFSQLGLAQGKTEDDAIAIIRQAVDLGVNLFDTAAAYGTEAVLGTAIKSVRRDEVVITTKAPFSFSNPHSTPEGIVASLDKSLPSSIPVMSMYTSCTVSHPMPTSMH